jgi:hypothetical protein
MTVTPFAGDRIRLTGALGQFFFGLEGDAGPGAWWPGDSVVALWARAPAVEAVRGTSIRRFTKLAPG